MNLKKFVAAGVATALVAGAVFALGATAEESGAAGTDASAEEAGSGRIALVTPNTSWEKWWAEYPDQVDSFFDGMDEVESDGKVHSHALLYANVQNANGASLAKFGTACASCKSTMVTTLYDEMGVDAFSQSWDEYGDQVDWWECALCHEDGVPGAELTYGAAVANVFGTTLLDSVDPEEAACGQCHNFMGATYGRGVLMDKLQSGEVSVDDVDPYRYGVDPDSLMKAALEDGYEMPVDETTGIANFQANHPEVEVFQGSVHDSLGLTCVDCHMVEKTNADGETYTSHNASSSPLENEEAMEFCLTCHAAQGIEDTDAMRQFVLDAQEEVRDLETVFYDKQAEAKSLIAAATANGGVDEDVLQTARDTYTRATWYVRYADGGSEVQGQKVAHNPDAIRDYIERATVMMDEIIASLQ